MRTNALIEDACKNYSSGKSFDVVQNKLEVVEDYKTNEDRIKRVILFLNGLDWRNYQINNLEDAKNLNMLGRHIHVRDYGDKTLGQKVMKQMFLRYMQLSKIQVSDTEINYLLNTPLQFEVLIRAVTLLHRYEIPIEPSILTAMRFAACKDLAHVIGTAAFLLKETPHYAEKALIIQLAEKINDREVVLSALRVASYGFTFEHKLEFLLILSHNTHVNRVNVMKIFQAKTLPANTFEAKALALKTAVSQEDAHVQRVSAPWLMGVESEQDKGAILKEIKGMSFETREATLKNGESFLSCPPGNKVTILQKLISMSYEEQLLLQYFLEPFKNDKEYILQYFKLFSLFQNCFPTDYFARFSSFSNTIHRMNPLDRENFLKDLEKLCTDADRFTRLKQLLKIEEREANSEENLTLILTGEQEEFPPLLDEFFTNQEAS